MLESMIRQKEVRDRANILTHIVSMNIYQIDEFAKNKHKLLMTLYEERIINDPAIEQALNRNLREHSRKEFRYLTDQRNFLSELWGLDPSNSDNYPNHEYLIHGVKLGVFSVEQIQKIPITPFSNFDEYFKHFDNPNILDELRIRLLNPDYVLIEKPKMFKFLDDPIVY